MGDTRFKINSFKNTDDGNGAQEGSKLGYIAPITATIGILLIIAGGMNGSGAIGVPGIFLVCVSLLMAIAYGGLGILGKLFGD